MENKVIAPEFVAWGRTNQIADQIADYLLDYYLAYDPNSKTSFNVLVTSNQIVVTGNVMSYSIISASEVVREALHEKIGFGKVIAESYAVMESIQGKAFSINRGVEREDPLNNIGADSSCVVFGYATNETENFMPPVPDFSKPLSKCQLIAEMYRNGGINNVNTFCGCDPSKVRRSATYAARHLAKNLAAAGVSDEIIVQVAYVEGIAKPVNFYVNTCQKSKVAISDNEISHILGTQIFDMRPKAIEERLKLRNPIYADTSLQGHFGQKPQKVTKKFKSDWENPQERNIEVELFTWEKLDYVDVVKKVLNLK